MESFQGIVMSSHADMICCHVVLCLQTIIMKMIIGIDYARDLELHLVHFTKTGNSYNKYTQSVHLYNNILCLWVCLSGLLRENGKSHVGQTWWVGEAWSNLHFLGNFLVSCYYRSSLHEFLCFVLFCFVFFGHARSHTALTGWVGGAWAN